jgi:hypothetical protein
MNGKRRMIVVSAIGMLALLVTTGWSVLAGDTWPPQAYQAYSPAGAWIDLDGSGDISIVTLSPEDPRTGTGCGIVTEIDMDPTFGGMIPEATSWSPGFLTYVVTGPDTARVKGVYYVKKDEKPKPTILNLLVIEMTPTMTAPDTMDYQATISVYDLAADKDGDGLPDADEPPLMSLPLAGHMKRI